MKFHYRHALALRRSEATSEDAPAFSWTILDAIIALKSAWNKVTSQTIANCYRKSGFVHQQRNDEMVESEGKASDDDEEVAVNTRNVWDRLREFYGYAIGTFDDYVNVDNDTETARIMTDEEIVAAVSSSETDQSSVILPDDELESDTEADDDPALPLISTAQAREAVKRLRYYGLQVGDDIIEDYVEKIDNQISKLSQMRMKQTKIIDYFKKD